MIAFRPFSLIVSVAGFALAAPVALVKKMSRIGRVQRVASFAMRSLGEMFSHADALVSAPDVFKMCHRFKMEWIHAMPCSASVIKLLAGRNRSNPMLICDSVRETIDAIYKDAPIADAILGRFPQPAFLFGALVAFGNKPRALSDSHAFILPL